MNQATAPQLTLVPATTPAPRPQPVEEAEAPAGRLLERGGEALTDAELLAVLLDEPEPQMARRILERAGGLAGLSLLEPRLVARRRARQLARLRAALELARRMARAELPPRRILSRPHQVASYLHLRFARASQEVMGALFLDVRRRLIADREFFRGTHHRAAVEPRTVLRGALALDAAGVVLFHTHPSGDPAPSREDLLFTRRFARAAEALGVECIDHLIVAHGGGWVSLRERGGW